jgi:hypothetical protein
VPIDIQQFNQAAKRLDERILEFLSKNPSQAYSLMEIISALVGAEEKAVSFLLILEKLGTKGSSSSPTWDKYLTEVESLLKQGKIVQAQVHGITYYAYAAGKP